MKSVLCYWKVKKIFGFKYNIYRPEQVYSKEDFLKIM